MLHEGCLVASVPAPACCMMQHPAQHVPQIASMAPPATDAGLNACMHPRMYPFHPLPASCAGRGRPRWSRPPGADHTRPALWHSLHALVPCAHHGHGRYTAVHLGDTRRLCLCVSGGPQHSRAATCEWLHVDTLKRFVPSAAGQLPTSGLLGASLARGGPGRASLALCFN